MLLAVGLVGRSGVDSFAKASTLVFKSPDQLLPIYRVHFTRSAKLEAAALDKARRERERGLRVPQVERVTLK